MRLKLGLKPAVNRPKLNLKNYVNLSVLPTPPPKGDWSLALSDGFSMLGNGPDPDNPPGAEGGAGCCFFAAATELIRCVTANAQSVEATLTTGDNLRAYSLCTGWNPKDPATDQGTEPGAGFNFLMHTGIAGHKFGPIVAVDWTKPDMVRAAQWLFPGLMMGVDFPEDWEMTRVWDLTTSPVVGGHEIYLFAWDDSISNEIGSIASWGESIPMTWAAAQKYINQLTATVAPEWIADNNLAPSGFDLEHLMADEKAMGAI